MNESRVIIGTIGCYPFVRGYPLGSVFLQRLQAPPWPEDMAVREMSWGPVAVVQEMQALSRLPERVVLVTAVDRGQTVSSVHCRRWMGGTMGEQELQARMFEGVTGVVHVDNLLAIGEHFRIWPDEVLTVEVQLPYANVGDYLLEELETTGGEATAVGELPLSYEMERVVTRLVTLSRRAALEGARGLPDLLPLHAGDLTPVTQFCHNQPATHPITYRYQ